MTALNLNAIQFVREKCAEKGVKIKEIETALMFSNGYLNPNKQGKIPVERAMAIAEYLGIPVDDILAHNFEMHSLLLYAQAYTKLSDAQMVNRLGEKGIKIKDLEQYQMLKDGVIEREGLREAIREVCEDVNLDDQLMLRLSFIPKGSAMEKKSGAKISDRDIKAAFFRGADPSVTQAEMDEMWADAQEYFKFKIAQRRNRKENDQ